MHATVKGFAYLLIGVCSFGFLPFHLYTTYMAYQIKGVVWAALTFAFPPISEVFWIIQAYYVTGSFLQNYIIIGVALMLGYALSLAILTAYNLKNEK